MALGEAHWLLEGPWALRGHPYSLWPGSVKAAPAIPAGWNFSGFSQFQFRPHSAAGRINMKLLVTAMTITAVLAVSPASAKTMACTSENMAKLITSSNAMPDSPGKFAMMKEMGAANTAMSKGDMRGACKSYMRAQKMSGQKG
jgi:hypothetical protein